MSASRASPSSRTRRAVTVSSGVGRFLAGISRRYGRTTDRRAALPADARRRPVQRSAAARHAVSLPYELRDAREPPVLMRFLGSGPLEARRTRGSVVLAFSGGCAAKFTGMGLYCLVTADITAACGSSPSSRSSCRAGIPYRHQVPLVCGCPAGISDRMAFTVEIGPLSQQSSGYCWSGPSDGRVAADGEFEPWASACAGAERVSASLARVAESGIYRAAPNGRETQTCPSN
jgi:hypothetical protein